MKFAKKHVITFGYSNWILGRECSEQLLVKNLVEPPHTAIVDRFNTPQTMMYYTTVDACGKSAPV